MKNAEIDKPNRTLSLSSLPKLEGFESLLLLVLLPESCSQATWFSISNRGGGRGSISRYLHSDVRIAPMRLIYYRLEGVRA